MEMSGIEPNRAIYHNDKQTTTDTAVKRRRLQIYLPPGIPLFLIESHVFKHELLFAKKNGILKNDPIDRKGVPLNAKKKRST